jgi:hypothetical protein
VPYPRAAVFRAFMRPRMQSCGVSEQFSKDFTRSTLTPGRTRKEQIGHVDTGNQQHEYDRAHQDPERSSDSTIDVEVAKRGERRSAICVGHLVRVHGPE